MLCSTHLINVIYNNKKSFVQDTRRIFLVFGNQFVKLFLLGFHDGFANHSDVVVIDSDRDRDDFVFFGKAERAEDIFELFVGDDDAVFL